MDTEISDLLSKGVITESVHERDDVEISLVTLKRGLVVMISQEY